MVYHENFRTKKEAESAIFHFIEIWYNRKRRHSFLNYQTPCEKEMSPTFGVKSNLAVVKKAVAQHGIPEIINSDQGVQFCCKQYVGYLKDNGIRISMDGKGRCLDNIYIERFGVHSNINTFTCIRQKMA